MAIRPTPVGASTSPHACLSFCVVLGKSVPGRLKAQQRETGLANALMIRQSCEVGELGARRLLQLPS